MKKEEEEKKGDLTCEKDEFELREIIIEIVKMKNICRQEELAVLTSAGLVYDKGRIYIRPPASRTAMQGYARPSRVCSYP